jgi:SAM-dependent methyltransferase
MWPFVAANLPEAPARVVELGCGTQGGFVPRLRTGGYEATGIDPRAPDGDAYVQMAFEHAELPERVDAVVACTSLHHVAEPAEVLGMIRGALAPGGVVVVVEWAWEAFDEATARWCFDRLGADESHGWLHHHRDRWAASRQPWDAYLREWAEAEGIHPGETLLRLLDASFERLVLTRGPYGFSGLAEASEADEQAAIDAGRIRATRIDYAGRVA